ncbi:MAG: hypothetical protein KF819_18870 [Labilithrix sp.]|nr:hypothetical protein [Labilithrix sp.]
MRGGLALVVGLLAAGCASEAIEPAPTSQPEIVGEAPRATSSIGTGEAKSVGVSFEVERARAFVCRKGAFCDDFESALPGARWTATKEDQGGAIDFVTPSSSLGARSMRARVTASEGSSAYLVVEGAELSSRWSGALGFSILLDALPVAALGGPRIVVPTADGEAAIGVSMRPEGIVLEQSSPDGVVRADLVSLDTADGKWARVVIGVEASGPIGGGAFGRIEISVDGSDNLDLPLAVAPFGGRVEVRAGITSPDAAPATARVDDVMFFTR